MIEKKSIYLLILLFVYSVGSVAQKKDTLVNRNNEIKINTLTLIAFGALDLTYERALNEESSFGISIYLLGQNQLDAELYRTFSVTPYYRTYFSNNYYKGFFIEAFAMYYERKDEYYYDNYNIEAQNYEPQDFSGAALGVSVGGKWVTKKGFIAEISIGIGRVMIGDNNDVPVVGRGGILIGKRF